MTLARNLIGVTLVTIGLAAGLVWLVVFLPRAKVEVAPATSTRAIEREIILSRSAKETDYVKFILPARQLDKEAESTKKVQRSTAGMKDSQAKGTIILKNSQDEEQPLLPKTHLRHDDSGIFFLTDRAVRIPPQGEISVTVTAKEPGVSGNVPAGRFVVDKLPASMQKVVYGESAAAFTGGVTTESPVTEDEIKQALADTEEAAKGEARSLITAESGGAVIREDLIKTEVVSNETSAQAGDKVPEFEAKTKVNARGFLVNESDLLSLTLLNLRTHPEDVEELVSFDPDSFKVEILRADFERGEARIKCRMTGIFAKKSSLARVDKKKLAGRSEAEVKEYFRQFEDLGDVKVELWPFWVKSVPARESAMRIELKATK